MTNQVESAQAAVLTLVNLTDDADREWMRALKETSNAWSEVTLTRTSETRVFLEEHPNSYAVVTYAPPWIDISEGLSRGESSSEVLVRWQSSSESLIELYRRFWSRIWLVEADLTQDELARLASRIFESTGVVLSGVEHLRGAEHGTPELDPEALTLEMSAWRLLGTRAAREIHDDLEAITLGVSQTRLTTSLVDRYLGARKAEIARASQSDNEKLARESLEADIVASKQSLQIVMSELHHTQEELEKIINQRSNLEEKEEWLREENMAASTKNAELSVKISLQKQKTKWLREVRDQHRATARDLRQQVKDFKNRQVSLENKLNAAESEATNARSEISRIKSSRSWKYTRVIRTINGTESR